MTSAHRQNKLLDYIMNHKKVTYAELAEAFDVSSMTIRRDIKELEKSQLIERVKGGVVFREFHPQPIPLEYRTDANMSEKLAIGMAASKLIEEGDVIILDSGTTTKQIAYHLLNRKNITVIINDFNIYHLLKDNQDIKLFFAGGQVSSTSNSLVNGVFSHSFYKNFHVNKAFISTLSVDFSEGLFTPDIEMVQDKRSMIEVSQQVILVADHSKFSRNSSFKFAPIDSVDIIITDKKLSDSMVDLPDTIQLIKA